MASGREFLAAARREAKRGGWDPRWIRHPQDARAVLEGGCWFDQAAADRVSEFFGMCVHIKGEWAGQPVQLLPWQADRLIGPLFGWKRPDGTRRIRKCHVEIPKKNGKGLALDTPVPTPAGWTTIGDLQPGDRILGPDGAATGVQAVTPDRHVDCFELSFSSGERLVADLDHQWVTTPRDGPDASAVRVRSTLELFHTQAHGHTLADGLAARRVHLIGVRPVMSVATRCLMVDHPSHQFLVGPTTLPTHNSTIATGVSLYMLMGDDEPGAEVYNAAVDRFQTKAVFDVAMAMVRRSPYLQPFLEVTPSTKTIVYAATDSVYRALTAGAENKEGLNTHALICDELHAWTDRDYWGALAYSGSARRQPLIFVVTTAGVYDERSIGWEQHEYARKVEENIIHDWSFLPVMYAAGPKDKWTDPRVWERVNPCWGVTIKPETFAEECREAQAEPRKENDFRRYRLNQWVQQATRWIPLATWDKNLGHPIAEADLAGRRTWVGVDVGAVSDLTAEILITDCPHDAEAIDVFCRFWVPEGALSENDPDREPNPNRVLYQLWVRDGWLRTTPGHVTDYDAPLAQVLEDAELAHVLGVAIDQLFQGRQIATKLAEAGLEVTPFPQTFQAYGGPMKTFERLWRAKRVHHGGHPVLRWMADNTNVATNHQGLLKPVKPGPHSPRKIDGITALCMAIDQRDRADPDDDGTSRYETEGVRSV